MATIEIIVRAQKAKEGFDQFKRSAEESIVSSNKVAKSVSIIDERFSQTKNAAAAFGAGITSSFKAASASATAFGAGISRSADSVALSLTRASQLSAAFGAGISTIGAKTAGSFASIGVTGAKAAGTFETIGVRAKQSEGFLRGIATQFGLVGGASATATRSVSAFGQGLKTAIGFGSAAAAIAATIGVVRGGVGTYASFDRELARLRGSLLDTSKPAAALAGELRGLTAAAKAATAGTQFDATQGIQALTALSKAGLNAAASAKLLPDVLDLAVAANFDLDRSAQTVVNTLAQFQLGVNQSTRVVDVLSNTAAKTTVDIADVAEAMKDVGPISQALGLSIEEVGAAIGVLGQNAIKGSEGGTGLRQVLASLANVTPEAEKELRKVGLTSADLSLRGRTLTQVFEKIAQSSLGAEEAFKIFDTRGAASALAIKKSVEQLRELNASNIEAAGSTKALATEVGDNLGAAFDRLGNSIKSAVIALGDSGFGKALKDSINNINDFVRSPALKAYFDFLGSTTISNARALAFKDFILDQLVLDENDFDASARRRIDGFSKALTDYLGKALDAGRIGTGETKAVANAFFRDFDQRDLDAGAQRQLEAFRLSIGRELDKASPLLKARPELLVNELDFRRAGQIAFKFYKESFDTESLKTKRGIQLTGEEVAAGRISPTQFATQAQAEFIGQRPPEVAVPGATPKPPPTESQQAATKALEGYTKALQDELKIAHLVGDEHERAAAALKFEEAALKEGTGDVEARVAAYEGQFQALQDTTRAAGEAAEAEKRHAETVKQATEEFQGYIEALQEEEAVQNLVGDARDRAVTKIKLQRAAEKSASAEQAAEIDDYLARLQRVQEAQEKAGKRQAASDRVKQSREELRDALKDEQAAFLRVGDARERAIAVRRFEAAAIEAQIPNVKELTAAYEKEYAALQRLRGLNQLAEGIGDAFGDALTEVAIDFRNANKEAQNFLKTIQRLVIQEAISKPIAQQVSSFVGAITSGTLFGGSIGSGDGGGEGYTAPGSARINTNTGTRTPAAGSSIYAAQKGTILDRTTYLYGSGGRLTLAGEAGTEGILPLKRDKSGRLGVIAEGAGGQPINVNMVVYANDAGSFRRSRRQIVGEIARGVRGGA